MDWLAAARSTNTLKRVWVFGSFATRKPGPGDLDIVGLFAADFNLDALNGSLRHWFDHELCRAVHGIDLFILIETTPPETQSVLLQTLGRDRSGQESMVVVLI